MSKTKIDYKKILTDAMGQEATVLFSAGGVDIVFATTIQSIDSNTVALINPVPSDLIRDVMQSRSFSLQVRMVRFSSPNIDSDGENILFPVSELNVLSETRQSERFPFEERERVICEILNPVDKITHLQKTVLDMSAHGLSIRCPKATRLFAPGTVLPSLKVIIDGATYSDHSGEIVYCRKLLDLEGKLRVQVGIKFSTVTSERDPRSI